MIKTYASIILVFTSIIIAYGQISTEDFEIKPSKKKYPNALYNTIALVDQRANKSHFGFIREADYPPVAIIAVNPLKEQIQIAIQSMIDSTAKSDTLVLELKKLEVSEKGETGYIEFKANMFKVVDTNCYKINAIDTIYVYDFGFDVSGMLAGSSANVVSNFIANSLFKNSHDTTRYNNLIDLKDIGITDKSKMPAYANPNLKDGVYTSFESFRDQKPDYGCLIKYIGDSVTVKALDTNRNEIKYDVGIYIAVQSGHAFFNNGAEDYKKLSKENGEFVFVEYIDEESIGKHILKAFLNGGSTDPFTGQYTNLFLGDVFIKNTTKMVPVLSKISHLGGNTITVKRLK
jgi:hypothetical protein